MRVGDEKEVEIDPATCFFLSNLSLTIKELAPAQGSDFVYRYVGYIRQGNWSPPGDLFRLRTTRYSRGIN